MSYRSFVQDLRSGSMTRRQMLASLAAAGVIALPLKPARAQSVNLTVLSWAGYEDPSLHPAFAAKYGASPSFTFMGEVEEGLQKLRGGFAPDVAHPCTSSVERWKDAGVLKPIDISRIEQWSDIFPEFQQLAGVKIGSEYYNMPWDWGNESILYRHDKIQPTDDTIAFLLDERLKGQVSFFDSIESISAFAGKVSGAAKPWAMTDAEIEKAVAVMRQLNDNVRFYWTDATQLTQALASGEILAAWAWNAAVVELKKQNVPVTYMHPKEGLFTWVCGLSLVKNGTGDETQAYDFLNAMLDPQSGKTLVDWGYGHSNRKTFEIVPKEQLVAMGIPDPIELMKTSYVYEPIPPATKEKLIKIFDTIKAGL